MEKVPFFGWMFPQHDLRNLLKILRKWNGLWSHMFNFEWLMFADLHRICLKAHRVHKPGVRLQFLPYMFETREHVLRQHVKSHWWIFRMGRGSRCEGCWQKKKTDRGRGGFHINHLSILLKTHNYSKQKSSPKFKGYMFQSSQSLLPECGHWPGGSPNEVLRHCARLIANGARDPSLTQGPIGDVVQEHFKARYSSAFFCSKTCTWTSQVGKSYPIMFGISFPFQKKCDKPTTSSILVIMKIERLLELHLFSFNCISSSGHGWWRRHLAGDAFLHLSCFWHETYCWPSRWQPTSVKATCPFL